MLTFLLFLTIASVYLLLWIILRRVQNNKENHGEQATVSGNPAELVLTSRHTNDPTDFALDIKLPVQATTDGDPAEMVL